MPWYVWIPEGGYLPPYLIKRPERAEGCPECGRVVIRLAPDDPCETCREKERDA
jgi:hypothetical protein